MLKSCLTLSELRAALKRLPESLYDTYTRIIEGIPKQHTKQVRRIFQCSLCSFGSLDLKEVAELVAVDLRQWPVMNDEMRLREPQDILTLYSSLVSTAQSYRGGRTQSIEELRLAHHSVKEYLTSSRMAFSLTPTYSMIELSAHEAMTALCVRYLLQFDQDNFGPGNGESLVKAAPLAPYAAVFWGFHFLAASMDASSLGFDDCLRLIKNRKTFQNMVRLVRPWWGSPTSEDWWGCQTPIFGIRLYGLAKE